MNLDQIFNSSRDLQAVVDLNGTVRQINTAYMDYIGATWEEAIGSRCNTLFQGIFCNTAKCPLKQICDKKTALEMEVKKRDHGGRFVPFLLTATPLKSETGDIIGMISSFKDISRLKDSETRLRKVFEGTIHAMAEIVELRDPYTAGHQRRVAEIAVRIAKQMGLSQERVEAIATSAILHDIGKMYVPSEFLTKPGTLSGPEFEIIKSHSQKGYDILKSIDFNFPAADIVCQHHERIDGTGYPHGLKGREILLEARIIAVADVVEAISSHRPYRKALGMDAARQEINANKGIKYDAGVVDAFERISPDFFP